MLKITEIFHSIQGESSHAGRPCVFVRLTGCPLRCKYCDTGYAFHGGKDMSYEQIIKTVASYDCKLVEITGGEPLAQDNSVVLMQKLIDLGYELLLETSGAISIETVPKPVKIIMDLKTPSSNESPKNLFSNIDLLKHNIDEIKYIIETKEDFDYALNTSNEYQLFEKHTVLASPSFNKLNNLQLAQWILESKAPFRMQVQMHKYIWDPKQKGV